MTGLPERRLLAGASVIDGNEAKFDVIGILATLEEWHRTAPGQEIKSSVCETTDFPVGRQMAHETVLAI